VFRDIIHTEARISFGTDDLTYGINQLAHAQLFVLDPVFTPGGFFRKFH
jgi:hypothetical protein